MTKATSSEASAESILEKAIGGGNPPNPEQKSKKTGVSSLSELKGKTIDDDVLTQVNTLVEAEADRRVSNTRKKWETDLEQKMAAGQYMTREQAEEMLEKQAKQTERKAAAKGLLVESLQEMGVNPKKAGAEYKKFMDTLTKGLEDGEWTEQILLSRGGIRTVAASAGLLESKSSKKDDSDESDVYGSGRLPSQGIPVLYDEKTGKGTMGNVADSPEMKRRAKMKAAVKDLSDE